MRLHNALALRFAPRSDRAASFRPACRDLYGEKTVVFGGFWHNIAAVGPNTNCVDPAAQCTFFNDVWVFRPGNNFNLPSGAAAWTQLMPSTPTAPMGRWGHGSAVMFNQLFIYGGTAQSVGPGPLYGWSDEMWAFGE